jgi:hypothetical protein
MALSPYGVVAREAGVRVDQLRSILRDKRAGIKDFMMLPAEKELKNAVGVYQRSLGRIFC